MSQPSLRLQREERKRIEALNDQIQKLRNHPHVPHDFNWETYIKINSQIKGKCTDEITALRHWIKSGKNAGLSYKENPVLVTFDDSSSTENSTLNPISKNDKNQETRVCVLLHVYYTELVDEILDYLKNIESFDLYVNFVEDTYSSIAEEKILSTFPHSKNIISSNLGRDWGGFYRLSKIVDFDKYDVTFLIHTKRSVREGNPTGDVWRKDLLDAILKSKDHAKTVIENLHKSQIGVISSDVWKSKETDKTITNKKFPGGVNIQNLQKLIKNAGYEGKILTNNFVFGSGSIFGVKTDIIKDVFRCVNINDFEKGDIIDGTISHALERYVFVLSTYLGYDNHYVKKDEKGKIYIITPCSRPENLHIMKKFIPKECVWVVVYDSSCKERVKGCGDIVLTPRKVTKSWGKLHINYALDYLKLNDNDWLYVLDDDNIIHEEWYKEVSPYINDTNLDVSSITWGQLLYDGSLRIPPKRKMELGKIDQAQFMWKWGPHKEKRYQDSYEGDGHFAELLQQADVLIDKNICYYNFITKKP